MLESVDQGGGLYSFKEVAQYLGVHVHTLRSWFFPSRGGKPLLDPKILKTDEDGAWLSFNDFLQAFAVKSLKDHGLKPKAVREAIFEAKERHGLPYPLSVQGHKIYVDDNHKVFILPPGQKHPSQLAGKGKGQVNIREVIEPYLHLLEFDKDGMAARLIVFQEVFGNINRRVVMEPGMNFGEPTVEGTPYRVETLRRAFDAEGSIENVARIYEVQESEVCVAIHAGDAELLILAA
jgi:uncharacterized protein (DUF433 family)